MITANDRSHISVVVPVHNGEKTVVQTIECLLRQSLAPDEIIVVDDGSTDGTRETLRNFDRLITLLTQLNGGPASARNRGVEAAKSEFVAFTDSDCLPNKDWLFNLSRGFDGERVAGVGGPVRSAIPGLTCEYADAIRLLDPRLDEDGAIAHLITANACFRREALIEAGLFNKRFRKPGGEEPDLCFRLKELGYEFRYVEQALVLHYHRQTLRSFLSTNANYGEGGYVLGQLWPHYHIKYPLRRLLRSMVAMRSIFIRIPGYAAQYGLSRAVCFSLLDYLRQLAVLSGYLRGKRCDAQGERSHPGV